MIIPILGISVWFIAKLFVIFALGIYIIFALVVVRQIGLMVDTLDTGFGLPIKLLGFAHLAIAILVLLVSLAIL